MPNNSPLVRYMGKNYILEGQYDDSHRISLTKDTFKPAMSYPYNAIPETSYPYKNHIQMDLLNRPYRASLSEDTSQLVLSYPYIPGPDLPLYMADKAHYKQETYKCYDAKYTKDLGMVYKVFTPGAA